MKPNPLKKLEAMGQSIWLDYIKRDLITSGELEALIDADGLRGITSNPSIFESAIAKSNEYDHDIQKMKSENKEINVVYETLTQQDVRDAADKFRMLYNNTNGQDGFVSLEVNPHLAHDTQGTITEARRLWKALSRPNVLIKVPGTREGLPAITQLISEGININVTLLFGLDRYEEVALAYIEGLEKRLAQGKDLQKISSVASFFLSRIDVLLDPLLKKIMEHNKAQSSIAKEIHGEVSIASAKMAYQRYKEIFTSDRFAKLAEQGAKSQRLLWASTGTKDPAYSDIKYIEALIGPETVNTVPMETLNAYRDHGVPKLRLEEDIDKANWIFGRLPELGINIDKITEQLENEGVEKFNQAFDQLIDALRRK